MILTNSSAANVGATSVTAIASATSVLRQFMVYSATTISSVISGAIGLIKNGTGELTLSGSNTYSGGTMINAGDVFAENPNALGTGQVTLNSTNAKLILSNGTYENNLLVTDNLNSKFLNVFFDGINTYDATWSGTIVINETSPLGFIISTSSGDSITISGSISGAGSITKQFPGTLTLSGNNSFTAGVFIESLGGTVVVNNNNALGTGSVTLNGSNTKIVIGNAVTISNAIIISNSGDLKTIQVEEGNSAEIFSINNGETGSNLFRLSIDAGATLNVGGVISGAGQVTKVGSGVLIFDAANTYSGGTFINTGTLKAGGTNVFSSNSAVSIATGATVDLGGFNNTISSLSTSTGTITDSSSAGNGGILKIATTMPSATTPQLLTGSVGLQIFGGNTVSSILTNTSSTYSGGTIFGNGSGTTSTRLLVSGTIGSGSAGAVTNGIYGTGTITLGAAITDRSQIYFAAATTVNNNIIINSAAGQGGPDVGALRSEAINVFINGSINANLADVVFSAANATGRTITVNGLIFGNSGVRVTSFLSGNVIVTLNAVNNYLGATTITSGELITTSIISGPTGKFNKASFTNTSLTVTFSAAPLAGETYRLLPGATTQTYASVSLIGASGRTATYNSTNSTLTIA